MPGNMPAPVIGGGALKLHRQFKGKCNGIDTPPAPGLTSARPGIIIIFGSVPAITPPPLIGGGVRGDASFFMFGVN